MLLSYLRLFQMKFSLEQRRILAETIANIGIVWFGGGVVAPVFSAKNLPEIIIPGVWGLTLTIISITFSMFIVRKKR